MYLMFCLYETNRTQVNKTECFKKVKVMLCLSLRQSSRINLLVSEHSVCQSTVAQNKNQLIHLRTLAENQLWASAQSSTLVDLDMDVFHGHLTFEETESETPESIITWASLLIMTAVQYKILSVWHGKNMNKKTIISHRKMSYVKPNTEIRGRWVPNNTSILF